ncbi:hypothetical protein ACFX13_031648 [Malus domestica]
MVTSSLVSATNEKRGECAYVYAFLGTEEIVYGNPIPYLFTRCHAKLPILQRNVHRAEVQYSFHEKNVCSVNCRCRKLYLTFTRMKYPACLASILTLIKSLAGVVDGFYFSGLASIFHFGHNFIDLQGCVVDAKSTVKSWSILQDKLNSSITISFLCFSFRNQHTTGRRLLSTAELGYNGGVVAVVAMVVWQW